MPYIASTLTTDVLYTEYHTAGKDGGSNTPARSVLIKGGANVTRKNLETPDGVITTVSDDDLELLKGNEIFQLHEKNGFIKVLKSSTTGSKAAKDMTKKDESAPLVDSDYKKGGKGGSAKAPKAGKLE
jgi:hypothetical protein